jgi:outer membrane protein TolC
MGTNVGRAGSLRRVGRPPLWFAGSARLRAAVLCAAVLNTAVLNQAMAAPAQESAAPALPPVRTFRVPPRVGVLTETRLTLQQAIALALENNNDIEISKLDRDGSVYNIISASGVYDPVVSVSSQFQKAVTPVASSLGGSATGAVLNRNWLADPVISGPVPFYGGSYRLDFSSQRITTNNTFVTLNPQYSSGLTFQYTQPLVRGLRYDANRRAIDIARKNREISTAQFRMRAMQLIEQTELAYWELVYAYNNLQVQMEAVEIARQQDESNRRQEQQGLLAPIDVIAAQTQLANFELNAYTAQTALTRAENTLKTLMLPDRGAAMWASALVPTTSPNSEVPLIPLADAVEEAIAKRPEAAQAKLNIDINQSDVKLFKEQTRPQVDLVASYTRAGLAGAELVQAGPTPFTAGFAPIVDRLNALSAQSGLAPISLGGFGNVTPGLLIGDYGQSLNNLFGGYFPTTLVQLRVGLPLRNRTAEANLSRSLLEGRKIRNQLDQLEETIEADVRNTMQAMQSAEARLAAARVQRESAEEQYNSEQRQFRAGTSTLFLVQQRQSAMIVARSVERRAEADLAEAIAGFELAKGSILERHNVNIE